ncbi:MAG: polysaccharide biosynthesis protein [Proteobacteria bacterium]|nr:polysaccharide biosynthesis protein [Pseudomonadota bacterium]MBU4297825.1 polysaccharide biosynthesis protein [Pseudomonadota bacterium]MCG2748653.1 polysaccharide biosynthesis protein [Desulfobulbaceae bacterium]
MQKYIRRILFNRWAAFIHDLLWVPVVLWLSYWFRFNLDEVPGLFFQGYLWLTFIALPVYAAFFWYFGLYRGLWRFASMPDLSRIVQSVFLGSVVLTLLAALFYRLEGVPRTTLVLTPLLLVIALTGPRFCYRWYKDQRLRLPKQEGIRVLIVGAGHAGELLLRDLIHNRKYLPVALIDDDRKKHNREIHGVRVYGGFEDIEKVVQLLDIELVLLAIPSASTGTVKSLVVKCVKVGVECKTLPTLNELAGNRVGAGQLRPLTLNDLLGREAIKLDYRAIFQFIAEKIVLVTGGGGSIGSELCRQIAKQKPSMLIVFDNGEFNLYSIENELRSSFPDLRVETILGDVKDENRVHWLFKTFLPQVVFHAAAYKHVPMLEVNPAEGVHNNVFGSKVVADAADRFQAERFVFVSTDKAVNPANVMGTTKRIAEIYCQNLNCRSKTSFITTRFGNVLGSAGSVVPLFQKQIEKGGPVTVTHRDICRYFMTIPEAVSLILQAGSMGKGGEIFVLDMGEPVLITDLAEQMIRLSGLEPGRDIKIAYTGLRPGEKLYEEIFYEGENLQGTDHHKLLLAKSRQYDWGWLTVELEELRRAAASRDIKRLIKHLRAVVPEYDGRHLSENDELQDKAIPFRVLGGGKSR